jgi:hypothetical protein
MLLDLLGLLLIVVGLISAFARGRSIVHPAGPHAAPGEPSHRTRAAG